MSTAYVTQEAARSFVTKDIRGVDVVAGAAIAVKILDIPVGASIGLIKWKLLENFGGQTAAITGLTAKVGDNDDDDGFIAAASVLGTDTPVPNAQSNGAYVTLDTDSTPAEKTVVPGSFKLYTAAKALSVTFNKTGAGAATALFLNGRIRFTVEIIA